MTTADSTANSIREPLSDEELTEYRRLTAMIEDVEQRRTTIALLRHGLRRNPARLELLDERERQLYAEGAALMRIRAPLYPRFKWPRLTAITDLSTTHQ